MYAKLYFHESCKMTNYLEDHVKMMALRATAKKFPNGSVDYILKGLDEGWVEAIDELREEMKSEQKFVTKF